MTIYDDVESWQAPDGYERSLVDAASSEIETRFRHRYILSGVTSGLVALEQWEPRDVDSLVIGQAVTVAPDEVGRLDIIAMRYLGNWRYWWVVAALNGLRDPVEDVVVGKQLLLPKQRQLQGAFARWT